jgi:hypothetical protein
VPEKDSKLRIYRLPHLYEKKNMYKIRIATGKLEEVQINISYTIEMLEAMKNFSKEYQKMK